MANDTPPPGAGNANEQARDHTMSVYSARSSAGCPTGHVWYSVQDPQGKQEFVHYGPRDGMDIRAATSGCPGYVSDADDVPYDSRTDIPINKEQYDKLREFPQSQTKDGQMHGESKGDYQVFAHLTKQENQNNCVSFTFNAADHAHVEEARQYQGLTPNDVANKLDRNPSQQEQQVAQQDFFAKDRAEPVRELGQAKEQGPPKETHKPKAK